MLTMMVIKMTETTDLQEGVPKQRIFGIENKLHIVVGSSVEQLLLGCRAGLKIAQEHIPECILKT